MLGAIIGDISASVHKFGEMKTNEIALLPYEGTLTPNGIIFLAVESAILETEKSHPFPLNCDEYPDSYTEALKRASAKSLRQFKQRYFPKKMCFYQEPETAARYFTARSNETALQVCAAGAAAPSEYDVSTLSEAITGFLHDDPEELRPALDFALAVHLAFKGCTKQEIRERVCEKCFPECFVPFGGTILDKKAAVRAGVTSHVFAVFLESASFEDMLKNALAEGADAALAGALAEAYYGVPEALKRKALFYLEEDLQSVCKEWADFINRDAPLQSIQELYLELSDDGMDERSCHIVFYETGAKRIRSSLCGYPVENLLSETQALAIQAGFAALSSESWKGCYFGSGDALMWRLAVRCRGKRRMKWLGQSLYPPNWEQVLKLFQMDSADAATPKLEFLKIKWIIKHPDSPQAPAHQNTESLAVDFKKEQLTLKIAMRNCRAAYQYDVPGELSWVRNAAEACLQSDGWEDTSEEAAPYQPFYTLSARSEDGSVTTHQGNCNRSCIPEKPWLRLIDVVERLYSRYAPFGLFDKGLFQNVGRVGEVKYCSVSFDEYDRSFYYQTDDKAIDVGDDVVVPFGAQNEERVGEVVKINYYHPNDVPFPLEKTKKILRIDE